MNREKINSQLASVTASLERKNQQAQRGVEERARKHQELVQSRKDTLELAREASTALKKQGVKPNQTVSIEKEVERPFSKRKRAARVHMDGWQFLHASEPNGDYGISVHGYTIGENGSIYEYGYSGQGLSSSQIYSAEEIKPNPEETEHSDQSLQKEREIQLGIISLLAGNKITSLD